jgi:hypothetical protein
MSPIPQVTPAIVRRLTKKSPFPRTGVGQKSSAAELIGSGRLEAGPQGSLVDSLVTTQMSSSPFPPGRFDAMYMLRPSGEEMGQPSCWGVLTPSGVAEFSTITALPQVEKCGPAAAAAAAARTSRAVPTTSIAFVSHVLPRIIGLLLS